MSAPMSSITRAGMVGRSGLSGRRAWGLAVPLAVAGALAAGCGPAASGGVAGGTAELGATVRAAVHMTVTAAPVPTVSGWSVAAGGVACVGWPTGITSTPWPASFVPVSVAQCVNSAQTIPGKGLWLTATLKRSTSGLSRLIKALHQPSAVRKPGTFCPDIAMIPPQIVLTNAAGEQVIPRLPVGNCGLTAVQVLTVLNSLSWQPVSVRLIAPVPGATATVPSASGTAPHSTPTGGAVHPG